MEEVYGDKTSQELFSRDIPWSKSSRFLSHQAHHQIQLSFMPLSGGHQIPHSHSRCCKEFMENNFDEVGYLICV